MIYQANRAAPPSRLKKTSRPIVLREQTNDVGKRAFVLQNERGVLLGRFGDPDVAERRARLISKNVVWQ